MDEINTRLMARGGKKMAHFLVYNEPNLLPLFYHIARTGTRVERKGPEYLLPAFDTMLVALRQGVRRHPRPVRGEGLGDARTSGTRSRACAPTSATSSSTTCCACGAGAWRVRTRQPRSPSAERPGGSAIDALARSQLTDEQFERYIGDGRRRPRSTLPPEGFTKTLDALYASPRARKLDYLSLNVYEPFGARAAIPDDTDRRGSSGSAT